jgi:class 3 adenylate cyclase
MRRWLRLFLDLGVGERPPPEARRIRIINGVAAIAVAVNLLYVAALGLSTTAGAVAASEVSGLLIINTLLLFVAAAVPLMNRAGRVDVAMWSLFGAAVVNTVFAALYLGAEVGGEIIILVLPGFAVLITRPGDRRTQMIFLTTIAVAFAAITAAEIESPPEIVDLAFTKWMVVLTSVVVVVFIGAISLYFREIVDTTEAELQAEKKRSEELLLNILPKETADRLKEGETVIADRAENVSVLFADLVDSTPMAESLSPNDLVEVLNSIFTPFDDLADQLGLEKIKTIGDAYMVVGGLPRPRDDHLDAIADMALGMREQLSQHHDPRTGTLRMRFGIDTGPVVAGVIGRRKFSYDLWGNTVVTAARMESQGIPGRIQVTEKVRDALENRYAFEGRRRLEVKGKGMLTTYFLEGRRSQSTD